MRGVPRYHFDKETKRHFQRGTPRPYMLMLSYSVSIRVHPLQIIQRGTPRIPRCARLPVAFPLHANGILFRALPCSSAARFSSL